MLREVQITKAKKLVIFKDSLIRGHDLNLVKNGCSPRRTKLVK